MLMSLRCLLLLLIAAISGCVSGSADSQLIGLSKTQVVQRFGYPAAISMITEASQGAPGYEQWTYYERSPSGTLAPIGIVFTDSKASLNRVVTYDGDLHPDRIVKMNDWDAFSAIFHAQAGAKR